MSKIYPHPYPWLLEELRRLLADTKSFAIERKAVTNAMRSVDDARHEPPGLCFAYAGGCLDIVIERLRKRLEKAERVRDMLKELAIKENA